MKKVIIFIFCLMPNILVSQDITMTLGVNGVLKIWDGSTAFFTLQQSTGQVNLLKTIRLENTTGSSVGVIYKGYNPFIHDFNAAGAFGNVFMGNNSGNFTMNSQASYNTGIGTYSLFSNTSGYHNTGLGYGSLFSNNTGVRNTAIGSSSSMVLRSGNENTSVGYYSLAGSSTGYNNTAIGSFSMTSWNNSGAYNNAVGSYSLYSISTGYRNNSMGYQSLYNNSTGRYNTAIGDQAMLNNTDGYENTSVGAFSLLSNISGLYNVAIGVSALFNNSIGIHNTAIGWDAGYNLTTGSNNIIIGSNAQPTSPTVSGQITLGGGFITQLRCNVTSITSLSDVRDKKNIQDLPLGLDLISKLRPRQFNWDKREWYDENISDGSKTQEAPTAGFIAQELDEVQTGAGAEWLNLVLKDNPEKWEATPGNLLPVIVKAIQELKAENDKLKQRQELLEETINTLKNQNAVNVSNERNSK
ncbi:MAG: hypothetical protein HOP31_11030 [Ignavibacteria bacterium]|nr:hypothetical protein [Ignavibacteria bacterium]